MFKNILLASVFVLIFNFSYSQQKTVYEKKVNTITINFLNEIGLKNLINKYNSTGDLGGLMAMSEISYRLNTERGLIALSKFNKELKKAESLKSEIDFKRDKYKKNKEFVLKESIEKENIKKKLLEEYNNSDYIKISKSIKYEFEKWLNKSEFEKQENFLKRVKENSQKSFDSICNSILLKSISQVKEHNNLSLEVGEYNADREFFKIKIKIFNTQVDETLSVKLTEAKEFKENYDNRSPFRSVIAISNSINKWCFNNNELIPLIFDFNIYNKNLSDENYSKDVSKDISVNLINIKPLIFNTSELNIKNENFGELNYNFNDYNDKLKKLNEIENAIYDYENVEIKPEFIGGKNKLYELIGDNIDDLIYLSDYPKGSVKISFIVEKNGSLSNLKVIKDVGRAYAQRIIQLLRYSSSKWKSGELNGEKVRVLYLFTLN